MQYFDGMEVSKSEKKYNMDGFSYTITKRTVAKIYEQPFSSKKQAEVEKDPTKEVNIRRGVRFIEETNAIVNFDGPRLGLDGVLFLDSWLQMAMRKIKPKREEEFRVEGYVEDKLEKVLLHLSVVEKDRELSVRYWFGLPNGKNVSGTKYLHPEQIYRISQAIRKVVPFL